VAFCLAGGRALVAGIGDEVSAVELEEIDVTLLLPPFGVSTAAVYRRWDELGGPQGEAGNDLEPAALSVEPRLAVWRDTLAKLTGMAPRLAGSGSTWFVEARFDELAGPVGSDEGTGWVMVTRTERPPGVLL
jgi:4-diphosphocytidyl-2-C-methyl-D-erythritol kinase